MSVQRDHILKARGLCKRFGAVGALHSIDLDLASGRVLGMVGPNGAGKTTTLGCIVGLIEPDAGSLDWPAWVERMPAGAIGYAAQEIGLFPDITVDGNLRFFGGLGGLAPFELNQGIREITEVLELTEYRGRRVRDLSVGQQRLVHVAAAAVHRPPLLLLDEPTAGLDVTARELVLHLVRMAADQGGGVLFSSHYMEEVERTADDVVIIDHGRVTAAGGVDQLLARCGDPVVEVEIGSEIHRWPGTDIVAAIARFGHLGHVTHVRVVSPSLEAVFLRHTGEGPEESSG